MIERFYYVYIATNKWRTVLYIGITNNLQRRMREHSQRSVSGFTAKYNVGVLIYYEIFNDVRVAISREKQLKRWNRRKKEWLIGRLNPFWKDLLIE